MYLLFEFSVILFQCDLDVSFGHEVPVIFRLIEGSGPVHISAQQLVGKQAYTPTVTVFNVLYTYLLNNK